MLSENVSHGKLKKLTRDIKKSPNGTEKIKRMMEGTKDEATFPRFLLIFFRGTPRYTHVRRDKGGSWEGREGRFDWRFRDGMQHRVRGTKVEGGI